MKNIKTFEGFFSNLIGKGSNNKNKELTKTPDINGLNREFGNEESNKIKEESEEYFGHCVNIINDKLNNFKPNPSLNDQIASGAKPRVFVRVSLSPSILHHSIFVTPSTSPKVNGLLLHSVRKHFEDHGYVVRYSENFFEVSE